MELSYDIVNKFLELTGSQIDFLLYTGQFQDGQALAAGFDYREVCGVIDICKSNFYKIINSLVEKGFIRCNKINGGRDNWVFEFLGNQEHFDNGGSYLYLNLEMLQSKEFINLKRNEKLICLSIIKRSYLAGKEIFTSFERMCELTGAKLQTVKQYAKNLQAVFKDMYTIEKNGIRVVNLLDGHESKIENKKRLFNKGDKRDIVIKKSKFLVYYCKHRKIDYDMAELEDTAKLYEQYSKQIPDAINRNNFILEQVKTCIDNTGKIVAAYVNTLISNALKGQKTAQESYIHIPRGYDENFIPYSYCYDRDKMKDKLDELLGDMQLEYYGNELAQEVLSITKGNLVYMLTSTKEPAKIKESKLTHRQIYEKLIEASKDKNKTASAERFTYLIREFIEEVTEELPDRQQKQPIQRIEAYLKTWLYDAMNKKTRRF